MRVMRVLTRPNLGGPTRQAIALWHSFAARGVATLLVTGRVGADEAVLSPAAAGVPRLEPAAAIAAGHAAAGWVELPSLRRGLAPLGDLRAAAAIRALVRSFAPDVVHTHTSKAGFVGRRAALAAGAPVLAHTFHGHVLRDYFPAPVSAVLAALERRLASRTDLLFAVSDSCADELAAAGVAPRERFRVVRPAVAVGAAAPAAEARARLGVVGPGPVACCIGRLVPIKRIADFVAAIAAAPGWRGDVLGDGPQAGALARLAAAGGGRVRLLGAVPEAARWLGAYDALVLPSRREGFPLVAVEAFAAGVPVLGYDVPGVRDALTAGGGVLVPEAAGPAGLAGALRDLAGDPARAAALVTAGRAAVGGFAPAAVAGVLLAAYRACRG